MGMFDFLFAQPTSMPGDYGPGEAPNTSGGMFSGLAAAMQDPRNQAGLAAFGRALAQAGAPRKGPLTWGGGLSDAFAGMAEGRQGYDAQQFQRKFQEMKMREMETEAAKQQAEADKIKQLQQRQAQFQQLMGGNSAMALGAKQGDVGPTMTNAARIPQDPLAELRAKSQIAMGGGFTDEGMKMFKQAQDMRDKFQIAPSGEVFNPYAPEPNKNYGKVDYLDLGGVKVPVLPSGQIKGAALQKSQSPDSLASNALGWANYNKPVIQSGPTGDIFTVDPRRGVGVQVTGLDGSPLNKGEKPLTEYQGKSTGFGMRAVEADKIIRNLGTTGVAEVGVKRAAEGVPLVGGMTGAIANSYASKEAQMRDQAERDFVNAVLRQESGAAINKDEFENARRQYFPRVGDGPEVIKQKENNRKTAIDAFKISAGPGGKNFHTQSNSVDDLLKKYQ